MKIWFPVRDSEGGKEAYVSRAFIGKKEYRTMYYGIFRLMPANRLILHINLAGHEQLPDKFSGVYIDLSTALSGGDMDVRIECRRDSDSMLCQDIKQISGSNGEITDTNNPGASAGALQVFCSRASEKDYNFTITLEGSFPWNTIVPDKLGHLYNWVDDSEKREGYIYLGEVLTGVEVPGSCPIYAYTGCSGKAFSCKKGKLSSVVGNLFSGLEGGHNDFRSFFAGQSSLSISTFYSPLDSFLNIGSNGDFSYFFYQCAGGPSSLILPNLAEAAFESGIGPYRYFGSIPDHWPLGIEEGMNKQTYDEQEYGLIFPDTLSSPTVHNGISKMVGFYRGCASPGILFSNGGGDFSECFADSGIESPYIFTGYSGIVYNLSYMYSNCKNLTGSPSANWLPSCDKKYSSTLIVQGMFQGCKNISPPSPSFAEKLVENNSGEELLISGIFANSSVSSIDPSFASTLFSYDGPITAVSMYFNTQISSADESFWDAIPDKGTINVNRIFGNCSSLSTAYHFWDTHEKISASGAYEGCYSIDDYDDIPEKYKVYDLELWNNKEEEEQKKS